MNRKRKSGRKPKPFIAADGTHINGLRRRPSDGRWELADGRTFSEPDERKALQKFYEMTGDAEARFEERWNRSEENRQLHLTRGQIWRYVADMIRQRPKWVAEQTGIEQIAYLSDLKPPQPLPTFAEIETIWRNHFNKSEEQKRKVLAVWNDFTTTAKIGGIRDICPETVIAFRDAVAARNLSGKSQQNLFTRIRRLLSFARDRAVAVDALNKALEYLSLLKPSETTVSLDPKPIAAADLRALLLTAEGDMRAIILCMLNFAMYLKEVISLRWDDFDGDKLVTHRKKTGRCVRIGVGWPETMAALAKVKRRGDFIFYNNAGKPLGIKGAELRFRKLRKAAKVDHVTSSMMRDGAYTAAVEANINEQLCRLLAGHRSGISDHYVKRRPSMVAPVCEAIWAAYLAPETPPSNSNVAA
jgi:integrase